MTYPCPDGIDPAAWSALTAAPVAHRGLWGVGAPENSLAAFGRAAAAGYGMELDVRRSRDGEAMVFHDDRLGRITKGSGRVADLGAADLAGLALAGTGQRVPRLAEVLETVAGRSLILVELKIPAGEEGPLERHVSDLLDGYPGPVAVISFNPQSLAWFADQAPHRLRGLNASGDRDLKQMALARPHFLSLSVDMAPNASAEALRARGLPLLCWTVRSPGQWARVRDRYDNLMFEGFAA